MPIEEFEYIRILLQRNLLFFIVLWCRNIFYKVRFLFETIIGSLDIFVAFTALVSIFIYLILLGFRLVNIVLYANHTHGDMPLDLYNWFILFVWKVSRQGALNRLGDANAWIILIHFDHLLNVVRCTTSLLVQSANFGCYPLFISSDSPLRLFGKLWWLLSLSASSQHAFILVIRS